MKIKGILLILILFLAAVSAGFFYLKINKNTSASTTNTTKAQEAKVTKTQENTSNAEDLIVSPQIPKDKVFVESATLQKDGFLVARQMDDGQLSQVIEMSQPLKAGTHKNVTINLGSADVTNKELIVMIYEDYADDGVFNDLDMPALNENGNMIARYVKTGKPLPTSITEADSSGMSMPGMKAMAKVAYTGKGFSPEKIEVSAGDMVEFVNKSNEDMWVASAPHAAHTDLPTFDQFRAYKKGAIYRYVFKKKGTWAYHDHLNPQVGGVVTVK